MKLNPRSCGGFWFDQNSPLPPLKKGGMLVQWIMEILLWIMIFVLGACLGSFVNMAIYRTAISYKLESRKFKVKNEKRSFCDCCGKQLRWFENIPIVSWLVQGGKTRCCGKKLPISYPIVEIMMGLLFLINYQLTISNYQFNISFVLGLVVITLLVFSVVFDFKYMILPDFSTIILILIAFIGVVFDENNIIPYLLSAIGAFGFLLFLHIVTKGKGMGMGDVKYVLFMGLLLGPEKTIMAFYVAFVVGAIVGLFLMMIHKMGRKSVIPFGPFLILGTFVAWWFGNDIGSIVQKVLE